MSSQAILDAVGLGGRTGLIAAQLGWSLAKTRRALGKLEREGFVERHPRHTLSNTTYWLRSTKWQGRLQPDPYGCPYIGTPKPCPLCTCARRDSDEYPKGEDAKRLSGEAMPARAEGIAQ